jgi:hypothetical protein
MSINFDVYGLFINGGRLMVKIGHAYSDENNAARGGKVGDQTGKELLVQDWYNKNWAAVFRAKDTKVAEKIALAMEQACANNNIGYDQGQRTTLYKQAEKQKWNLAKITEKCECDCSSLVSVCVNAANIKVSKDMYTGNQMTVLSNTGKFEILTTAKYLIKSDYLRRGDILLGPGHTAVVLSNVVTELKTESARSFSKDFAGIYKVTAHSLNVRQGAGISKKIIVTIPKETEVKCYGYYTRVLSTEWLYVQFTYKGTTYTGFTSIKYLTK